MIPSKCSSLNAQGSLFFFFVLVFLLKQMQFWRAKKNPILRKIKVFLFYFYFAWPSWSFVMSLEGTADNRRHAKILACCLMPIVMLSLKLNSKSRGEEQRKKEKKKHTPTGVVFTLLHESRRWLRSPARRKASVITHAKETAWKEKVSSCCAAPAAP